MYATINVMTGSASYSGAGVWEAGVVSPDVFNVPFTTSGSLGAYVALQPNASTDALQVQRRDSLRAKREHRA